MSVSRASNGIRPTGEDTHTMHTDAVGTLTGVPAAAATVAAPGPAEGRVGKLDIGGGRFAALADVCANRDSSEAAYLAAEAVMLASEEKEKEKGTAATVSTVSAEKMASSAEGKAPQGSVQKGSQSALYARIELEKQDLSTHPVKMFKILDFDYKVPLDVAAALRATHGKSLAWAAAWQIQVFIPEALKVLYPKLLLVCLFPSGHDVHHGGRDQYPYLPPLVCLLEPTSVWHPFIPADTSNDCSQIISALGVQLNASFLGWDKEFFARDVISQVADLFISPIRFLRQGTMATNLYAGREITGSLFQRKLYIRTNLRMSKLPDLEPSAVQQLAEKLGQMVFHADDSLLLRLRHEVRVHDSNVTDEERKLAYTRQVMVNGKPMIVRSNELVGSLKLRIYEQKIDSRHPARYVLFHRYRLMPEGDEVGRYVRREQLAGPELAGKRDLPSEGDCRIDIQSSVDTDSQNVTTTRGYAYKRALWRALFQTRSVSSDLLGIILSYVEI